MKKSAVSIILTSLLLTGVISCNSNSGTVVEPPLLVNNIIDDNYRNYYEIFVYSYCDSDGDKIGDLNGITSKLSYISDLGYTGIWLTPIFTSASLHKYNASNYYEIDPSFGTLADFNNLISTAHGLGINVILDLVLNHSSKSAPYFQKAVDAHYYEINNRPIPADLKGYEDFYVFYDSQQEASDSRTKYYQVSGKPFYYEGNFDGDMPEFNFDSPAVWNEFADIMAFWQQKGVDGFRLDAVKYYYLDNTSKNVAALSKIKTMAEKNDPSAYVVGECWDSDSIISDYYKSALDSYFWFPGAQSNGFLKSSTNQSGLNKHRYVQGLQDMVTAAGTNIPAPFMDNHDTSRLNTSKLNLNKFLYGLLSMLNGTTFTYYGDEIGMGGEVGNDANVRIHMDWSADDTGETADPYSGKGTYNFAPVDKQLQDPNSLLNYYKIATKTRNAFPAIARGTLGEIVETEKPDRLVTIEKTYLEESIFIAINFSDELSSKFTTEKDLASYLQVTDKLTKSSDNTYTIPAYGIAVFK